MAFKNSMVLQLHATRSPLTETGRGLGIRSNDVILLGFETTGNLSSKNLKSDLRLIIDIKFWLQLTHIKTEYFVCLLVCLLSDPNE